VSTDAKWIIGTIVPAILVVAGLLSAQIAGGNASLNTRINDLNTRIDDLNANVNARFGDVHRRIDDLQDDIRELRALIFDAFKPDEPAD